MKENQQSPKEPIGASWIRRLVARICGSKLRDEQDPVDPTNMGTLGEESRHNVAIDVGIPIIPEEVSHD
jgi:hypothetical protein